MDSTFTCSGFLKYVKNAYFRNIHKTWKQFNVHKTIRITTTQIKNYRTATTLWEPPPRRSMPFLTLSTLLSLRNNYFHFYDYVPACHNWYFMHFHCWLESHCTTISLFIHLLVLFLVCSSYKYRWYKYCWQCIPVYPWVSLRVPEAELLGLSVRVSLRTPNCLPSVYFPPTLYDSSPFPTSMVTSILTNFLIFLPICWVCQW